MIIFSYILQMVINRYESLNKPLSTDMVWVLLNGAIFTSAQSHNMTSLYYCVKNPVAQEIPLAFVS